MLSRILQLKSRSTVLTVLAATALVFGVAGQAHAGLISATNTQNGLFDRSSGFRDFVFNGSESGFDSGVVSDVNIGINFAKADGEEFAPPYPGGTPFFNEIVFQLVNPTGTTVDLIRQDDFNSGDGPGFVGRIDFDQQAAQLVNVNVNRPQVGFFRPVGDLNAFNGQGALGIWRLFIADTTGADALRFYDAELNVQTVGDVAPVPELSTGILFALALMGLGAAAWRRKEGLGARGIGQFRLGDSA